MPGKRDMSVLCSAEKYPLYGKPEGIKAAGAAPPEEREEKEEDAAAFFICCGISHSITGMKYKR